MDPKVAKITQVPKIVVPIRTQNCVVKMAGVLDFTKETNASAERTASTNTFKEITIESETVVRQAQIGGTRAATANAVKLRVTNAVKLQVTVEALVLVIQVAMAREKARMAAKGANPQARVRSQSANSTYAEVAEVVRSARSAIPNHASISKKASAPIKNADLRT